MTSQHLYNEGICEWKDRIKTKEKSWPAMYPAED